jgi:hypothetical protein
MSEALGGPDEGLRVVVVPVDILIDGGNQFFDIAEHAPFEPVLREIAKEALNHIQPPGTGQ